MHEAIVDAAGRFWGYISASPCLASGDDSSEVPSLGANNRNQQCFTVKVTY